MLLSGRACFVLAWSKVKCQEVGFGQESTTLLCLLTCKFLRCLLVQHDRRYRYVAFSLRLQKLQKGDIEHLTFGVFGNLPMYWPYRNLRTRVICALVV